MTFTPFIPAGGNVGWAFLQSSREDQQRAFDNSTPVRTNTDHFAEIIGTIQSAGELVSDRRLLSVALGAFGLDDDINNTFFIRKVLEEGTLSEDAFANRLADKRYFAMADAFGFHLQPPNTALSDFASNIIRKYQTRQFEVAVGQQDKNLRLALGIARDLDDLAARGLQRDTAWYSIMGNPPVRNVFERAFGLPAQFAAIDIDQQLNEFREKSASIFGTDNPADFASPTLREKLISKFLLRANLAETAAGTSRGAVALSLLQSAAPSS